MALAHPARLERLAILNVPHPAVMLSHLARSPRQMLKSWYIGFFQLPGVPEELFGYDPIETARFFFRRNAINQEAFSSFDIHVMATAIAQPEALTSALNWYRAVVRDRSAFENVRPIEAPTLLIWAEDDVALGRSLTYGLEPWISHLQVHYISHCGHWVQNEAPEEVNAQLLEFLQQT